MTIQNLYSLIKNELETNIGTIQWASIKIPMRMLPKSAPILPNIVPIDAAMPLKITTYNLKYTLHTIRIILYK